MKQLYDIQCRKLAKRITTKYSTSFSLGIYCLEKSLRQPIFNLYAYVRVADEIVDTFHGYDKRSLLDEFEEETYKALDRKISTNPVLNAFQETFHEYKLEKDHVETFLASMRMDLDQNTYTQSEYEKYILGSAEVVGLMCLKIFVKGNEKQYQELKPMAMALGSAFQKVNFLRDLQADFNGLGRVYFPNTDFNNFSEINKSELIEDIDRDFEYAFEGIKRLPKKARFGVYLAYKFYKQLLNKIKQTHHQEILEQRIRISNSKKCWVLTKSYLRHSFNTL